MLNRVHTEPERSPAPIDPVDQRILTLLITGARTSFIAESLGPRPRSVQDRLRHLRLTFAASNNTALAATAVRRRVI